MRVIDFIERLQVVRDIVKFVVNGMVTLHEAEQQQIKQRIAELIAQGDKQKVAEAKALWERGLISDEGCMQILQLHK